MTGEFGKDNLHAVTVVSKEECYHYLVPANYRYIVGVNLWKLSVGYSIFIGADESFPS